MSIFTDQKVFMIDSGQTTKSLNHRPALVGQVDFLVMRGVNEMKITKEMVKKALEAYAEKRHPARWDGEPWGEAGRCNHEAAIRNALEVIFTDYKLVKKDDA